MIWLAVDPEMHRRGRELRVGNEPGERGPVVWMNAGSNPLGGRVTRLFQRLRCGHYALTPMELVS